MTSSRHHDSFSSINQYWIDRELQASEQELQKLLSHLVNTGRFFSKESNPIYLRLVSLIANSKEKPKSIIPPEDEMQAIDNELAVYYHLQLKKEEKDQKKSLFILSEEEAIRYSNELQSPRLKFLLDKRQYLNALIKEVEKSRPKESHFETQSHASKKKNPLQAIFDIGKKFIDLIDDLWSAMRSFLPHAVIETVGPVLIGATGFIIHLGEGYQGGKDAYNAYKNEKIRQRKTRIVTSVLTFMAAGAGAGLSLAYIASAAGASVAGVALMPVLIPGLLTAVYGLSLWRRSYIFDRSKIDEANAEKEYQKSLSDNQSKLEKLTALMKNLKDRKDQATIPYKKILEKVTRAQSLTSVEANAYQEYIQKMNYFTSEQGKLDKRCAQLQGEIEGKWRNYQHCRAHRLEAEREVAFTTIEVAASASVLIGISLGTAAVVGAASVATFGLLPLALIISGVVMGAGSKIFEHQDEKNNFALTTGIRNWFVNTWDKVKSLVSSSTEKAPIAAKENAKSAPEISRLHRLLSASSPVNNSHAKENRQDSKEKKIAMKGAAPGFFVTSESHASKLKTSPAATKQAVVITKK